MYPFALLAHLVIKWKLEIEGTLSAIVFIKTPRFDCCFVPNLVYLYELQVSIVKHFSVDSIKFELGKKEKDVF